MHEELIAVAYDLLSSYVLPNKVYEVAELFAYQALLDAEQGKKDINYYQIKMKAITAAASALHAAHKRWDEEIRKQQPFAVIEPINWGELEMQA